MDSLIRTAISEIIEDHKELLKLPISQRAKFEGWLKFELAHKLQQKGMEYVEVESKVNYRRDRTDITFFHDNESYSIELKTPNTNWKIKGVNDTTRPITKNISTIIDDTIKLNPSYGIVAFVLFPIPLNDDRWIKYINRISETVKINIDIEKKCCLKNIDLDFNQVCSLVICSFNSRTFTNSEKLKITMGI